MSFRIRLFYTKFDQTYILSKKQFLTDENIHCCFSTLSKEFTNVKTFIKI